MNKKGYTLVELLAVIMILGIIALIAIPTVSILIEDSKKKAAEVSALHYLKAIEDQNALAKLLPNKYTAITSGDVNEINVNIKGDLPKEGTVTIENGKVTGLTACIGGYNVTYDGSKTTVGSRCGSASEPQLTFNGTFVAPEEGETHKGIVYVNPANISASCNLNNSSIGTGKTGCLKFYVFNDTGDTYKMILDHNTTATIRWNPVMSGDMSEEFIETYNADVAGWYGNPRLITESEVRAITGNTSTGAYNFGSDDLTHYPNQTKEQKIKQRSLAWLFEYTDCKYYEDSGCYNEDRSAYGYWTQTVKNPGDQYVQIWIVNRSAFLDYAYSFSQQGYGIRPVIELPKSLFE